jgi:hypothetical protein
MVKRINGRLSRPYVQRTEPFKNSNGQLYAEWHDASHSEENNNSRYVVYSYGTHWPLFVYVPSVNTWFENREKYGPTTSKHRTQTHPHCDTVPLSLEHIKLLASLGYSSMAYERVSGNV